VLLDISDQGVGMGAEEMAHANWRLDNPPVVDVAVSRRMGLFVVARLAARHGIRVRLRPAPTGGLTALVWLPDETVTHEGTGGTPGTRRFDRNGAAAGADSIETVPGGGLGAEWGARRSRSTAEEVNAARAPRFTPLHGENGDSADTAGIPPLAPSWDAPASPSATPAWGDQAASPGWDTGSTESTWENGSTTPANPAWEDTPDKPAAAAWEDGVGSTPASSSPSSPPPAASTGPLPSVSSTGPIPAFGASLTGDSSADAAPLPVRPIRAFGGEPGQAKPEVVVPPAGPDGQGNRLPIFESVESDWFRRGRHSADRQTSGPAESTQTWTSAADEGWRAAEAVSKPASGGVTLSGLPKRVPKANLVPGTVSANAEASPPPLRSAAATRQRFASFQRGVREARAAAQREDDAGGEGDGVT
jgi:hypothetical protein